MSSKSDFKNGAFKEINQPLIGQISPKMKPKVDDINSKYWSKKS